MAEIVTQEQFLLLRAAAEQQRAAESMRDLAQAVGQFVDVVDQACEDAKAEMAETLARTQASREQGEETRRRALAVLDRGDLDEMIAERDRLMAERARWNRARS